jgi:acyl-CoA synthetase (AMP-forming)/AMP-acid ligase II
MVLIKEHIQSSRRIEQGSLFNSLVQWAALQPEATFIVEAETGREISYAQTLAAVHAFRQALGDTPRHLALALPGGILNAVIWLSVLSGGHHLIPVSPKATEKEKLALAQRHKPDMLIVEHEEDARGFASPQAIVLTRQACEALCEMLGEQSQGDHKGRPYNDTTVACSSIVGADPCGRPAHGRPLEPREGRVYLTTSGSTGTPKSVVLSERQIAWTARQICSSHALSLQDRGLTVLPFFHVNAPVVSLCATLLAGGSVIIAGRFSRSRFWSWIEQYHITWASIVPTIVALLLETERPAFLPGALRFMRTGSAPLPAVNLRAFEERFGIPLIETYGLSEAASQVVANPLPPGQHKPGSAGLPTGVDLRICYPRTPENGPELRDVHPGEIGEICIAGPAVIQGYQNNEGQDAFQDGWFRTGDLGYLDEEGYLFIKGRQREVINRGGENIAPREIEETLQSYSLVREAAVVGRPDPIYGEQVVAYLTVRGSWDAEQVEQLHHYLMQHLSSPKVPVDLIVLPELPRNATGKIDRRLLRAREQAHSADGR